MMIYSCLSHSLRVNSLYLDSFFSSMSPSSAPPVRLCPPLVTPEDGQNLYSASGILTYIQCTTRRAYQQVLEVLDDSQHR